PADGGRHGRTPESLVRPRRRRADFPLACRFRSAVVLRWDSSQKRKRVRPPGSVAKTTVAERGSMRYTFHGGGPSAGALNGAVTPDPLSSGSAGQPPSVHALAMRATAPGSVTRAASPSITTSASLTDNAI